MRRFAVLSGLAGLLLLSVLIAKSGFDDVASAAASAGWAAALVVLCRICAVTIAGLGWRLLFPAGPSGLPARICVLLRFVREGINQLLPVGQIGGDVAGARLATFWGVRGSVAGAATVADVALQAGTQFVFALAGLALLVTLRGDSEIVRYAGGGLVIFALLLAGFFTAQIKLGTRWLAPVLARVPGGRGAAWGEALDRLLEQVRGVYAEPGRVLASALIHLAGWMIGSLECYLVLWFMGYPITFAEAVVIESLGQAVRGAAFAVPGGLGVQEGGFVALCGLFGVPAGPALAMALVKRVPDLVLGIPSIGIWQMLESRRAFRPAKADPHARDLAECAG